MAIDIEDLTLDEVVRHLIAGNALQVLAVSISRCHCRTAELYSPSTIKIAKPIGIQTKTPTSWTGRLIGCSSRSTIRS